MAFADAPGGKSKCPQAVKKAEKKCPAQIDPLATGKANEGSINNGADQYVSEAGKAAAFGAAVTGVCEQAANDCLKECKGEEAKQCDRFKSRTQSAANETAEAASAGAEAGKTSEATGAQGAEGSNPMNPAGMMGALSGLAGMLGKKNDNKQQPQQPPQMPQATSQTTPAQPQSGAVGAMDCNKADAYNHTECNDTLVQACTNNYGESRCQSFANRYCSSATEGAGSGLGSYFCKNVNAFKFCQQAGREACPSCQQLAANKNPNCKMNPALCLLQQSPSDIAKAKQSCPTDPAFSDPSYVNGGGALLPPNLKDGGPAVLPQSVGSAGSVSQPGPAPDVQSQHGPSIFSVGTQALRNRCQAGKLLNCP